MAKSRYLPADDPGKCTWLSNFAQKLPGYTATFGLTAGEVTAVTDANAFFTYVCDAKNQYDNKGRDWTAYKNIARNGSGPLGVMPAAPTLAAAPTMVPPDIFGRMTALVARLKAHPNYTEAIGQNLGIVGAEETIDPSTMKPVLTLALQAGRPNIGWKKQGLDGLEIHVDRGTGFIFLALDTIPDYLDTAPLPAAGTSAVWKYKAIYRLRDEQVGQWSDVASVSVMG